jgi:hypothetical protein
VRRRTRAMFASAQNIAPCGATLHRRISPRRAIAAPSPTSRGQSMSIADKTEPFLWGAAAGAVALAIVGFTLGGWMTGGTAQERINASAQEAMLAALTPICVAQFRKDPKAKASLAALKETDSWKQAGFVSNGGWATVPGSTSEQDNEVAAACADALTRTKQ